MYVNTAENISDRMSKPLLAGEKGNKFCKIVLHFLKVYADTEESNWDNAKAEILMSFPTEWNSGIKNAVEYFGI